MWEHGGRGVLEIYILEDVELALASGGFNSESIEQEAALPAGGIDLVERNAMDAIGEPAAGYECQPIAGDDEIADGVLKAADFFCGSDSDAFCRRLKLENFFDTAGVFIGDWARRLCQSAEGIVCGRAAGGKRKTAFWIQITGLMHISCLAAERGGEQCAEGCELEADGAKDFWGEP